MHSKFVSQISDNKKGFSLVELIIVIAIMVALIAILAPNYIKYIDRARKATVTDAAETVASFCKTEYAAGEFSGNVVLRVGKNANGYLEMTIKSDGGFSYSGKTGVDALNALSESSGFDNSKQVKADIAYLITIKDNVFSRPDLEDEQEVLIEEEQK